MCACSSAKSDHALIISRLLAIRLLHGVASECDKVISRSSCAAADNDVARLQPMAVETDKASPDPPVKYGSRVHLAKGCREAKTSIATATTAPKTFINAARAQPVSA